MQIRNQSPISSHLLIFFRNYEQFVQCQLISIIVIKIFLFISIILCRNVTNYLTAQIKHEFYVKISNNMKIFLIISENNRRLYRHSVQYNVSYFNRSLFNKVYWKRDGFMFIKSIYSHILVKWIICYFQTFDNG